MNHYSTGGVRAIVPILLLTILSISGQLYMMPVPAHATTVTTLLSSSAGYAVDYTNRAERQWITSLVYSNRTDLTIDAVSASWRVPNVRGPLNGTSLEDIDIYGDNGDYITVGTNQRIFTNGTIVYRAFYGNETSFLRIRPLSGKVGPGTLIHAEILKVAGDDWNITITPGNNPADSYMRTITHPQARHVAEWLVEPFPGWTLANFTYVTFNQAHVTVNGISYRLNDLGNQRWTMFDPQYVCPLSDTSNIGSSGDSFTVSFIRSTSPCTVQSPAVNFSLIIGAVSIAGPIVAIIVLGIKSLSKRRKMLAHPIHDTLGSVSSL